MSSRRTIPLIKVNQWMDSWEHIYSDEGDLDSLPRHFYVGAMSIADLRVLAGVPRREIDDRKVAGKQPGYQRVLDVSRSNKIAEYIRWGFPISSQKNISEEARRNLINPGWLPGAIILNVRKLGDLRELGEKVVSVSPDDVVDVVEGGGVATMSYPQELSNTSQGSHPIEIIDGQHRVYSIDDIDLADDISGFQVPVVVFHGLEIKWQAYLFWVINVEPKKINPSLAFDLYPELRRQDWLEKYDELKVYREHRAQELAEILWRHADSPWRERIELFGNRVPGHVSNAAFIRSLLRSFVKNAKADLTKGGLYGSVVSLEGAARLLHWNRPQQAALIIEIWSAVRAAVLKSDADWVEHIRSAHGDSQKKGSLEAFEGKHSLLATDQGVNAVHEIFNDYLRSNIDSLDLASWVMGEQSAAEEIDTEVSEAYASLQSQKKIVSGIRSVAKLLVDGVDWRLPTAPGIEAGTDAYFKQNNYRGSSGYRLLYEEVEAALLGGGIQVSRDIGEY